MCGIIIAADCYAMQFKAAMTVLNLIAGLILSETLLVRMEPAKSEDEITGRRLNEK